MLPSRYFFLLAIVAIAAILSVLLWNGELEDPFTSTITGNSILLTSKERHIGNERAELKSTNTSSGVWSHGGFISELGSSNEVTPVPSLSQGAVSGDGRLEYGSQPTLSDRVFVNKTASPDSVSSNLISDIEFLFSEGHRLENVTLIEEILWTKAQSAKHNQVKRDLTSGFIVEDFELLYGNDLVMNQDQLSLLIRRVVEDLKKCDLMSLFSNFVTIPGYNESKSQKKIYKPFRSKRSVEGTQVNAEVPVMKGENRSELPESEENQIKHETEEILKRSKRSFDKLFSFLKPDKALRLVPELIRGEGYPSEIHKVVTQDGYVLELHRIPAPRNTKKSRKKKFQKRDIHRDTEEPDRYFEAVKPVADAPVVDWLSSSDKIGNLLPTNSDVPQADQVLSLLERNLDHFNILPHAVEKDGLKSSGASSEPFKNKSFIDKMQKFSKANNSFQANQSTAHRRTKRALKPINIYPIFIPANYDSSPEYVTSNLKRKKIPTAGNLDEVFDVFSEKWVPRPRYRRPSVLIHHGLFASSANFVLSDGEGGALAYMLANAGYDVWLGNWRGNTYSTGHARLDPSSRQYWNFSLDEIIKYDIPAAVNYILAVSGQYELRYVGHSLGCAMLFGATNEDPSLASKIKMMIAMAPAAFMDNSYGALKNTILSVKNFYYVLDRLRLPDLLTPAPLQVQLANHFCGPSSFWRVPCLLMVDAFMGKVKEPMKEYYTNVLLSHFPSTLASTRILAHFGQFVNSYGMRKYNYGPDENYLRYGQAEPPKYSLSTVTFPVVVFWGPGDTVVTPEDVMQSARRLPNLIVAIPVFNEDFNHLDFIFPEQAQGLVYKPILQVFWCCDRSGCDRIALEGCLRLRRSRRGRQPAKRRPRVGRGLVVRTPVRDAYTGRARWPWFIPVIHVLNY